MTKLLIFAICSIFSFSAFSQTVATAGAVKISKAEFEKSYKQALLNSASLNRLPTKAEHLEDMVRFQIGLQEAEKTNLRARPVIKKSLDLTLYKGLLEVSLAKKVNKIKVSESEMKTFYRKNPIMRSGHIFVKLPNNPNKSQTSEASRRANKLYSAVITGKKKWTTYVRMFSDDKSTKTTSGDLGYQSKGGLYPTYFQALKPLKVGQVSKPIRGPYGFHIIKKTGQLSYERSDKNAAKIAVFNQKRIKILDRYFKSLKKKYKVSYNKDLL